MEIDSESKADSISNHSNKDNEDEDEEEEDNNSQIEQDIELNESKEEPEKETTPNVPDEKSTQSKEERSNPSLSPFANKSNSSPPLQNEQVNDEILIQEKNTTYCPNLDKKAFTDQLPKEKNIKKARHLKTKRSIIKTNSKSRNKKKKKIPIRSVWIPITPQMILHTLYRLRFFKLGPTKKEIIANLILHYPVRNHFNELARELRQKLRCAVQSGLLTQNGSHYKVNNKETKGNRLQKKHMKDFWRYYMELRPVSEPRKQSTPIDYEPFAEPL